MGETPVSAGGGPRARGWSLGSVTFWLATMVAASAAIVGAFWGWSIQYTAELQPTYAGKYQFRTDLQAVSPQTPNLPSNRAVSTAPPAWVGWERVALRSVRALGPQDLELPQMTDAARLPLGLSQAFGMLFTYLLASRYHAIVTSMPGGVLSVGVTMDERIRNLMDDRGHAELCFEVEDPDLANRVARALERVANEPHRWQPGIDGSVVRGLEEMGRMGTRLAGYVHDRLPTFPLPEGMGRRGDPWAHLPPLSPSLVDLVTRHRATEAA